MRHRDRSPLPEDVVSDLEAIEAALAGTPVDPDRADLAALAVELRDQRPRPDAGAAARLDERAAEGFARRPSASRGTTPRWRRLPALGVAATLAIAVITAGVISGGYGAGDRGGDVAQVAPEALQTVTTEAPAEPDALPEPRSDSSRGSEALQTGTSAPPAVSPGGAADEGAPVTEPAPKVVAPTAPAPSSAPSRSVQKGAELNLATTPAKLDDVVSGVVRATDAFGGYVVSSSTENRGRAGGSATFELRVPAAQLQPALARLSNLARVRSRNESSLDVTGRVVAARDAIDALQAERRGVLRQLSAATTEAETARARARLRVVDNRLARAKAVRESLRRHTAYSTISVDVVTERPSAGAGSDGGDSWTTGDALSDALRVLSVALGATLVALAALLPLALLAAIAWGAWHVTRARRRDSALDAAS